ncbi:MAG: hypothetical protein IJ092_03185 [Atopobiaceae bacterium]|nr:hypothetical protein [Atopobiaceae bacterium]
MDAEAHVIAYLSEALGVRVSADVPPDRPDELVTVEQLGAQYGDHALIGHPSLAIQSWAPTRYRAAELARGVHEAMMALPLAGGPVTHVSPSGPYNFPTREHPRYQAAYTLTTHE